MADALVMDDDTKRRKRAPKRRGEHAIPRARTINRSEIKRQRRKRKTTLKPAMRVALKVHRPKTRGDCVNGPRPCPWIACQHHLYLDVNHLGSIKINHNPGRDVVGVLRDMPETCALDVADRGVHTLEEIGFFMNVVRERVRQIEVDARQKMADRFVYREACHALSQLLRAIAQLGPMAGRTR